MLRVVPGQSPQPGEFPEQAEKIRNHKQNPEQSPAGAASVKDEPLKAQVPPAFSTTENSALARKDEGEAHKSTKCLFLSPSVVPP